MNKGSKEELSLRKVRDECQDAVKREYLLGRDQVIAEVEALEARFLECVCEDLQLLHDYHVAREVQVTEGMVRTDELRKFLGRIRRQLVIAHVTHTDRFAQLQGLGQRNATFISQTIVTESDLLK